MKKLTQLILTATMIVGGFVESGLAQSSIAFSVNMNYQIAKGKFNPATDFVDVVGFDGTWTEVPKKVDNKNILTDTDNDGIYTITKTGLTPPTNDSVLYKYRINGVWANSDQTKKFGLKDGNRLLITPGDGEYETGTDVYLDEQGSIERKLVRFNVNMAYAIKKKLFNDTSFVDVTCFDGNCNESKVRATNPNVLTKVKDSVYTTTKWIVAVIEENKPKTAEIEFTFRINGAWTNRDDVDTTNKDLNNRKMTINFAEPKDYIVDVTYLGTTTKISTGIKDLTYQSMDMIFENPVSTHINILNQNIFSYSVYDITGQMKLTGKSLNGNVNVADLSSGIYFMQVMTEANKIGKIKFVKE